MKTHVVYEDGSFVETEDVPFNLKSDNRVFSMPANEFTKAVSAVEHASLWVDDNRYFLQAICVEVHNDHVRFAATDGRRFAMRRVAIESGVEDPVYWIISNQALRNMEKVIKGWKDLVVWKHDPETERTFYPKGNVSDRLCTSSLVFTDGFAKKNAYIGFDPFDEDFPLWRRVVPDTMPMTVTVNTNELYDTLANMFRKVKEGAIPQEKRSIVLDFDDEGLHITPSMALRREAESCTSPQKEAAPAIEEIAEGLNYCVSAVMPYSDFRFAVSLSAEYILDALNKVSDKTVDFGLRLSTGAVTISPTVNTMSEGIYEDAEWFSMVMPFQDEQVEEINESILDSRLYFDFEPTEETEAAD